MRNLRMPQPTVLLAALLALIAVCVTAAEDELLPRPDSLQPAIAFWTRVYTEVDSVAGYVHDSRNLGVVYETLHLKWYNSPQQQERTIAKAVQRYRTALLALAEGKREDLNDAEQTALALWGENADGERLKTAAGNVRFQRGQSDRFRDGMIRAGVWEDHIRETLRELDLPTELAALPHVESSYHPVVRSSAGAAGLWQFTRFTGRRYLRVDHVVDERLDPLKSTEGAARFLQQNYSVLKSWPLAITAYNHGLSGVRRAVRETGSADIGDIVRDYRGRRFGFASRNFYAAFLAAVDVSRNIDQYFGELERDSPGDYGIVEVPAYLPIGTLTRRLDVDEDILKTLNPALQRSVWAGIKYVPKGYQLRLPAGTGDGDVTELLERIAMADGYATQVPDIFYKVRRGDTLSAIALRHEVSVRDVMALNNLPSKNRIRIGQSLRLPNASPTAVMRFASLEVIADDSQTASFPTPDAAGEPLPAEEEALVEAVLNVQAGATGGSTPEGAQRGLFADPADYEVAADQTIEVQVAETLSHYADWLETPARQIREVNGLQRGQPLAMGRRIRLDFANASTASFEQRRLDYHQGIQSAYFKWHRITGACSHTVRPGDSLWIIAARDYGIPVWLLRQYNPDVDFGGVLPQGAALMIPLVEKVEDESPVNGSQTSVSAGSCTGQYPIT
jgi:membrane-bound lytic murein transglycosylase D